MKARHNFLYLCLAALIVFSSLPFFPTAVAKTDSELRDELNALNSQISELQNKIKDYESQANELAQQADSLQRQIALLQNEQATLKVQIDLKQAEHDQIVSEIEIIQQRINENSDTVGYVIAQYYYNDDISTIERLASSESFSSFVDNEARLSTISDTLSGIIEENNNLKNELVAKKNEAEQILADLAAQKEQLAYKENQQAALLAETRGNEANYRNMRNAANAERERLEKQQDEILSQLYPPTSGISAGDPNKGGYPWSAQCPAAKLNGTQYGDSWNMYICECTSYGAWRAYNRYGSRVGNIIASWGRIANRGHAKYWPEYAQRQNAANAGFSVGHTPRKNSLAVITTGPYGHVVWVESVSGNYVTISQYNERNAVTNYRPGEYSMRTGVPAGTYAYYIYLD